jgi:uncharacterized delta-60 repeat protein
MLDRPLKGTPESFGLGGGVLIGNAFGFAAALQPDGKILVGAHAYDDMFVFRLLPSGSFDGSFGNGGVVFTDFGGTEATFALAVQPDGKILAAGRATTLHSLTPGDFAAVRYNPNGSLDSSFGGDGKVRTDFGGTEDALDLALQSDGKIVAVGAAGWSGSPWAVALDPEGRIVAAGGSRAESAGGDMTVARVLVGSCAVPRLNRLTVTDAQARLEEAGCRLGTVGSVKSKTVKRGRVVSQTPRPGARLDDFAAVNVLVSRGRR